VLVPVDRLRTIARSLAGADVRVEVRRGESGPGRVAFSDAATTWTVLEVDGTFPDFNRIIPRPAAVATRLTLRADDLRRALRLARAIDAEIGIVRLAYDGPDRLVASARAPAAAAMEIPLPAVVRGLSGGTVAVSHRYLGNAVDACEAAEVVLEVVGPSAPLVLRPVVEDGRDDDIRQVVMPMRVAG
jgi:DNA polymerase III sliding clamp (beta) subunit (PCNA family)